MRKREQYRVITEHFAEQFVVRAAGVIAKNGKDIDFCDKTLSKQLYGLFVHNGAFMSLALGFCDFNRREAETLIRFVAAHFCLEDVEEICNGEIFDPTIKSLRSLAYRIGILKFDDYDE